MKNSLIENLVQQFSRLPSIGGKSAQRLAYHILEKNSELAESLASAIVDARRKIRKCGLCHNYSEADKCSLCLSPGRNPNLICVVERPSDIILIEKFGAFTGLYHVLGGALSPLDGVGPQDLNIDSLLKRLAGLESPEVILALNTSSDGEATGLYLIQKLKPMNVKVTQLARGIPLGSDLQYVDEHTMQRAMEYRIPL
jgi:recombination protein RecR